jgi:glycosyltransferase involved in cell wall biosynthesis
VLASVGRPGSVLFITTVPATLRSFLLPYADHFRKRGWRIDAAARGATRDDLLPTAFDRLHDVPLSRSMRDVRGLVRAERELERLIAGGTYDIVHVHTPIASFLTRIAARRARQGRRPAIVYTAHGFHFHKDGRRLPNVIFRSAERLAGRWTDRLVVINEQDHQAALRHRIVPPEHLVAMPGIGVDTTRFSPEQVAADAVEEARRALRLPADAPVFVLVGEFSRNKRHRDAIKALEQMRDRRSILVFAGAGRGAARVEAMVRAAGLTDRVRFAGFVPDVRPLIRASTALILPSAREGLARSVMEALALEVPAVTSSARGNMELVGDDAGFVVGTGDVVALAARMDWLAENAAERGAMGRAGRRRMVERFDQRHVIAMHEALYSGLLEDRSPSASR